MGKAAAALCVCALLALGCEEDLTVNSPPPVDEQEQVFDATGIGRVELTLTAEALDELESDPEAESFVPGDFSYTSPDKTFQASLSNVGIRYKGNTSLDARLPKLPLKVRFNEYVKGQKLAGMKKLGFGTEYGDPSFVREALSYSLARKAGTLAPRTQYVRIAINGEDRGLYLLTEEEDDEFLESNFADGSGNLYKVTRGPLLYWGENLADYETNNGSYAHDEGPEKDNPTFEDLLGLASSLSLASDATLEAELPEMLDVEAWLDVLAVSTLEVNLDAPTYSANNYYLYNDPETQRFNVLGWDMDSSFGAFPPTATPQEKAELSIWNPKLTADPRPLVDRVLGNAKWQPLWEERLSTLRAEVFDPSAVQDEARAIAALIKPELESDPRLIYGYEAALSNLEEDTDATDPVRRYPQPFPGLLPFIAARAASVDAQLASASKDWPRSEAFVQKPVAVAVDVTAPTSAGDLYVYVQGQRDGSTETYLVRSAPGDVNVNFNTTISLPAALEMVVITAFLDVDRDDWIDPGKDWYGSIETPAADAVDAQLELASMWDRDREAIWASKFGAPTGL